MCDSPTKSESEGEGEGSGEIIKLPCRFCGDVFLDIEDLWAHKKEMVQREYLEGYRGIAHIWCEQCDLDFYTWDGADQHFLQVKRKQNIDSTIMAVANPKLSPVPPGGAGPLLPRMR